MLGCVLELGRFRPGLNSTDLQALTGCIRYAQALTHVRESLSPKVVQNIGQPLGIHAEIRPHQK